MPYYFFPLYIKIKIGTDTIISFHYSMSRYGYLNIEREYVAYRDSKGEIVCDVIADEDRLTIALGSETYTSKVIIKDSEIRTKCIKWQYLLDVVEQGKNDYLEMTVARIIPNLSQQMIIQIQERLKSLNILSYSEKDKRDVIKLISICYDFYLQDPENELWLRDSINGFLMLLEPDIVEMFVKHIPNLLPNSELTFPDYKTDAEVKLLIETINQTSDFQQVEKG